MVKAIIFDFFGVIQADPYQIWLNKHGLKREGPYAEVSDAVDRGLISKQQFLERLAQLSGQRLTEVTDAFFDGLSADEHLVGYIKELRKTYKIGLLSNSNRGYLRPILEHHGISDLFDEIIISSEVRVIKPNPRIFEITLRKMDLRPEEAIFIDDNRRNTDAAQAVGIKSIHYIDLISLKEKLDTYLL